jgi:hypothetical protein
VEGVSVTVQRMTSDPSCKAVSDASGYGDISVIDSNRPFTIRHPRRTSTRRPPYS